MKILVCGHPGSGKTKFIEAMENAVWPEWKGIIGDKVSGSITDWMVAELASEPDMDDVTNIARTVYSKLGQCSAKNGMVEYWSETVPDPVLSIPDVVIKIGAFNHHQWFATVAKNRHGPSGQIMKFVINDGKAIFGAVSTHAHP